MIHLRIGLIRFSSSDGIISRLKHTWEIIIKYTVKKWFLEVVNKTKIIWVEMNSGKLKHFFHWDDWELFFQLTWIQPEFTRKYDLNISTSEFHV